ncbi:MAG: hypothetical protein LUO93_06055 [Methanomicrobiales archaeon]|nr:hypothetical protein [Methanomicrobiales archaeon]
MPIESKWVAAIASTLTILSFVSITLLTPPPGTRVSSDQAIQAIRDSPKVDGEIVTHSSPSTMTLQWTLLDWDREPWIHESPPYHIFLAAAPPTGYEPYWFVKYITRLMMEGEPWEYEGKYIVDASSGELLASVEMAHPALHNSTRMPLSGDFWTLSLNPPQADSEKPYKLKAGETLIIDAIVKAKPAYDASLSLTFEATDIRPGLKVSMNSTTALLRAGGSVAVRYSISRSGEVGLNPTPNPNWAFGIDVHGCYKGEGLSVFIEP